MKSNREAYGEALVELFEETNNIAVLDADLAKATFTDTFRKSYPEYFFDCGIAEQNMIGVAAGLSTLGIVPFVSTFAVFAALRASEQFRNSVCYPNLNVKIVATHAGVECGPDGATHQCLEDIAVMRTLANTTVMVPCDPISTNALVKEIAKIKGPCYMRLGRDKMPNIYDSNSTFKIGGSNLLIDGSDCTIIAIGSRVHAAIEAHDILKQHGISARVIDMYSIKPIDTNAIEESAKIGNIFTVEDHQKSGGLGSAVSEYVTENCPTNVFKIGIENSFGRSGDAKDLYKLYKIDTDNIVQTVLAKMK